MTLDNDVLLDRIDLLRRVLTEHEPLDRIISAQVEVDERLALMGQTIDAARRELDETYRVIQVTNRIPDEIVLEILQVRVNAAGGFESWCDKIHGLGIEPFQPSFLRKHLELHGLGKGAFQLDGVVREALYYEDHAAERERERARANPYEDM
jgi:hypothetical protein